MIGWLFKNWRIIALVAGTAVLGAILGRVT